MLAAVLFLGNLAPIHTQVKVELRLLPFSLLYFFSSHESLWGEGGWKGTLREEKRQISGQKFVNQATYSTWEKKVLLKTFLSSKTWDFVNVLDRRSPFSKQNPDMSIWWEPIFEMRSCGGDCGGCKNDITCKMSTLCCLNESKKCLFLQRTGANLQLYLC